ncbi:helix-turn-helix domain-containing protein [Paraglaciecola aquimarina]|uniref:Helix-turn-helix domain-containing protein n=1 Tax=Paraglaciecola algarum TaxID=3050085 RepID=A0ABS9D3X9_9ALTE|nr:helix-turn-helix domain-containing protein [Paraglaciecola sp. G1-23]MCF2947115.1 helix-turn-helix domain-containing protein [Paraglaciecola sp. G1-23]
MSLGKKLKTLRAEHNLSQPELAEKIGIEQSYLSKLENDKSIPSNDIFNNILATFGLTIETFMADITDLTVLLTLQQIPDIRHYLASRKEHSEKLRRRFLYFSSLLIVVATSLFYAGFSKLVFPVLQYQYESKWVVLEGEPDNIFSNRLNNRVSGISEELKAEIHSRTDEKVLISPVNKGRYFVMEVDGGKRKYHQINTIIVQQPVNAWLQILGVFLFSAGIMGFILERKL